MTIDVRPEALSDHSWLLVRRAPAGRTHDLEGFGGLVGLNDEWVVPVPDDEQGLLALSDLLHVLRGGGAEVSITTGEEIARIMVERTSARRAAPTFDRPFGHVEDDHVLLTAPACLLAEVPAVGNHINIGGRSWRVDEVEPFEIGPSRPEHAFWGHEGEEGVSVRLVPAEESEFVGLGGLPETDAERRIAGMSFDTAAEAARTALVCEEPEMTASADVGGRRTETWVDPARWRTEDACVTLERGDDGKWRADT